MRQTLFQCESCGCAELSTLGWHGRTYKKKVADEFLGKKLCCVCAPKVFLDGTPTGFGNWHNQFERKFYPHGLMVSDGSGGLARIKPSVGRIFKEPKASVTKHKKHKQPPASFYRCEGCGKRGHFATGKCEGCRMVSCKKCGKTFSPTSKRNNKKLCFRCEDSLPKDYLKYQMTPITRG